MEELHTNKQTLTVDHFDISFRTSGSNWALPDARVNSSVGIFATSLFHNKECN